MSQSYLADRRFQKRTTLLVAACTDPGFRESRNVFLGNMQGTGNQQGLPSLPEWQARVLCRRGPEYYSGPDTKTGGF